MSSPTTNQITNTSQVNGVTLTDVLNSLRVTVGDGSGDMLRSVYDSDNDGKVDIANTAESVPWTGITEKPTLFPAQPYAHEHAIADVTGLQTALNGKQATLVSGGNIKSINGVSLLGSGDMTISTGTIDHGALTGLADDDHPQYLNNTRGDARYAALTHTHAATSLTASGAVPGNTIQWGSGSAFRVVPANALIPTGLVEDGVTDNKTQIQAALNTGRPVYLPSTTGLGYKISSRLTVAFGNQLWGDERKTKIITTAGDWAIEITGGNSVIQNLQIDSSGANQAGTFLFRCDIANISRCFIRNIESYGSTNFILDFGTTYSIVYLSVENCIASQHRGPGVSLTRAFAYLKMRDVTIDYVGSASRSHTAFTFVGNQGAQLAYCDVTNGIVDGVATGNGFQFTDCIAVWMDNCMADTVPGIGFYFTSGCSYIYMNKCIASLCGGHGFYVPAGSTLNKLVTMTGCVASGRAGQGVAPANANGFTYGATQCTFVNCVGLKNTLNGFSQESGSATGLVSGCHFRENTGRGIVVAGTGTFLGSGNILVSNTAGNYSLGGSLQHIQASMNASGALINATGPGSA